MEINVNRNLLSLFCSRQKIQPASVKVKKLVLFDEKNTSKHTKSRLNHRKSDSTTSIIQDRLKIVKKIQSVKYSDQSLKKLNYLRKHSQTKNIILKPKLEKPKSKIRIIRIPRVSELVLKGNISAWG